MRVEFHPEAIAEARAARIWYAEKSPRAADAFMRELDKSIERIIVTPLSRAVYVSNTRRYFLRRFPFALVYRVVGETIEIVAVAHGRRKPGYWKSRVRE